MKTIEEPRLNCRKIQFELGILFFKKNALKSLAILYMH